MSRVQVCRALVTPLVSTLKDTCAAVARAEVAMRKLPGASSVRLFNILWLSPLGSTFRRITYSLRVYLTTSTAFHLILLSTPCASRQGASDGDKMRAQLRLDVAAFERAMCTCAAHVRYGHERGGPRDPVTGSAAAAGGDDDDDDDAIVHVKNVKNVSVNDRKEVDDDEGDNEGDVAAVRTVLGELRAAAALL